MFISCFCTNGGSRSHLIPSSLIKMLGGLAMINVLIDSLKTSFSGRFKTGALFSFLITISGISLFHIGAPFWGLVGGTLSSFFLDRTDLKPSASQNQTTQSV